ncbi:MAG: ArsR/SmtB family transcription factor [Candidatus Heimdallarchaeota archaeon]
MDEEDFFWLVGNKTRRDILRSVTQEPKYLFQLAQELNRSNQTLQKHLHLLLDHEWLECETVEGPHGPARKLYRIAKNIAVRITLTRHAFKFDVLDITLGHQPMKSHAESLSRDLTLSLEEALETQNSDFDQQIQTLDAALNQAQEIENFLLSRKLSITGDLNETISMKLEGDAHRKDRELAYTIFSRSDPITLELVQKEVKSKREDLLISLRRLQEKDLLPKKGLILLNKLETAINNKKG